MQETAKSAQRFYQLTLEGCQLLAALCDLCETEKLAIESHNLDEFKNTLIQKQQQLELIGQNIEQRNAILEGQGHSIDESGLDAFLQTLPDQQSELIRKHWVTLSEHLAKSIELNQRNELIVKRGQKNVSQLLSLMQGHTPKTTLYNQKGSAGNYSAQNRLGKA